jgi:NAD(P)-dependent dehydrogenase (short-subunit alcohol dehydrogenase family)
VTITPSITGVTTPYYSIYTGHKAATEHYVRGLAKELGSRGITVNAAGPGPINAPFYFRVETEQSFNAASRMSGAGRLGESDEIVPLIALLCTPDAQCITAQTIRINGGMTAWATPGASANNLARRAAKADPSRRGCRSTEARLTRR